MADTEVVDVGQTVAEAAASLVNDLESGGRAAEFFGEEPSPEAPEKEAAEDTEKDVETESVSEEGEKPEAEKSEDDTSSTEEQESKSLETLAELAEQLEVPLEDLMANISHKYRAAGEEHSATLADLVKGNQFQADYNKGKEALATTRKQLEQDHRERAENYGKQLTELGAHFKVIDDMLVDKAESQELANIREVNPGEYAARVVELDQKRASLNTRWQEIMQQNDALQSQNQSSFYAAEIAKVEEKIEDWGPERANQFLDAARGMGFEDAEIPKLIDHRVILGVMELHSLRDKVKDLEGQISVGKKAALKVKKTVPKMMKPGKGNAKVSTTTAALERARKAVKAKSSVQNQTNLWLAEMDAEAEHSFK